MIRSRNRGIMTAIEEVKAMNLSRWVRARYEMRLKAWRDQKAWEDTARRQGRDEGELIGERKQCRKNIFELLEELGEIPEDIRSHVNEEENLEIMGSWLKIAARAKSFEDFRKNMN